MQLFLSISTMYFNVFFDFAIENNFQVRGSFQKLLTSHKTTHEKP